MSPSRRARRRGSVLVRVLVVLLAWVLVPFAIAEIGVRLLRPGFPGYRLPQVQHRPTEPYGFELVPGQHAFNVAAPVSINAAGFRGPELREDAGYRVLCLGDSFTFGYGVPDADTYPRQLEALLRESFPALDPEVVNTGAQGYATYQELDLLEARGLALHPDAVVIAVYHNDLEARPEGDYAADYVRKLAEAEQSFRHRMPRLYWAFQNSAAIVLGTQLYRARAARAVGSAPPADEEAAWRTIERELGRLEALSRAHDFFPLVIVIPQRFQLAEGDGDSRYPGEVLAIAERQGLAAIDLRPVLREALEEGVDPYLAWDHHHGPEGNRRLALAVRDRLAGTPALREARRAP